jgi:hypothetical protein
MSSLAILAQAGHAKAPPFNAIFYATVATVIPVLFVAVALQPDTFAGLIRTARTLGDRNPTGWREAIWLWPAFIATSYIPWLALVLGVWGEIQALLDLYLRRPIGLIAPLNAAAPFIPVVILTVAAAIGPARNLVGSYREMFTAAGDATGKQPQSPGETGSPAEQAAP